MKKLLAFTLTAILLLLSLGAAAEDIETEIAQNAVVMVCDAADNVPLGSGIVLQDGSVVTAAFRARNYILQRTDGTPLSVNRIRPALSAGLTFLYAEDLPQGVMPDGSLTDAASLTLVWYDEEGVHAAAARREEAFTYLNTSALLVQTDVPADIGALVLDETNRAVGMVAAHWGTADLRYVLVPLTTADAAANAGSLCSVSWADSLLTLSWSPEDLAGLGDSFTVCCLDAANDYYYYVSVSAADGHASFSGVPGHSYLLYFAAADDSARRPLRDDLSAEILVPAALPCTEFGYTVADIYVGLLPAGLGLTTPEKPEPQASFTRAELSAADHALYVQVTNTYQVTEEVDRTLLITLTAPDGSCRADMSGYLYAPEMNENDCWNASLDKMLREQIASPGGLSAGEYQVDIYIGGKAAGSVSFTVTD